MKRLACLSTVLVLVLSLSRCQAQEKEKISLLLDRSPAQANAIGYLNVASLNRLMDDAGFTSKATTSVEEVWLIADLDLAEFRPRWEAGYAVLKKPVNAEQLASAVGGYVDTVEGRSVVHAPQQTYFVPGTENANRLGILRPTDRRLLAGWLTPSINVKYSPFLNSQANQPESYLSLMLAVDLKNVLSPVPLATRIENLESLKANSAQSVANILSTIEGFSIIVGRQSLQQCIVKFHFSSSPASLKLIAPEMLAEILARTGSGAPEVQTWNATVEGNVLALQGPITQATLSGILSVFSMQGQAERIADRPMFEEDSKEKQVAYQSKHYFTEVTTIIERTRDFKAKSSGAMASWNDKRARQIDELATLNVDPEMIQYGTDVAELLRGNALSVRKTNIDAGKVQAGQTLDNGYYSNGYGFFDYNSTNDMQRVTRAVARGSAFGDYRETLSQIDTITAETRRRMTNKYNMQF